MFKFIFDCWSSLRESIADWVDHNKLLCAERKIFCLEKRHKQESDQAVRVEIMAGIGYWRDEKDQIQRRINIRSASRNLRSEEVNQ